MTEAVMAQRRRETAAAAARTNPARERRLTTAGVVSVFLFLHIERTLHETHETRPVCPAVVKPSPQKF